MKHHGGPLLGYNNNIPYKGHVYHVQTEDSGSKRPHVITHLFADGGRIIKTRKTSYAQFVAAEDMPEKVRALMREQHKGMVLSLRDGEFDEIIGIEATQDAPQASEPPIEAAPPSQPIELLERAAAGDDEEFQEEIERISTADAPKRPSGDPRPGGAYSFVGDREASPKRSVPRRMRATRPPGDSGPPTEDEAPPAIDVAGPAAQDRRRSASKVFGAAIASGRRLDELMAAFLTRPR